MASRDDFERRLKLEMWHGSCRDCYKLTPIQRSVNGGCLSCGGGVPKPPPITAIAYEQPAVITYGRGNNPLGSREPPSHDRRLPSGTDVGIDALSQGFDYLLGAPISTLLKLLAFIVQLIRHKSRGGDIKALRSGTGSFGPR